jgi:hypothetical protein
VSPAVRSKSFRTIGQVAESQEPKGKSIFWNTVTFLTCWMLLRVTDDPAEPPDPVPTPEPEEPPEGSHPDSPTQGYSHHPHGMIAYHPAMYAHHPQPVTFIQTVDGSPRYVTVHPSMTSHTPSHGWPHSHDDTSHEGSSRMLHAGTGMSMYRTGPDTWEPAYYSAAPGWGPVQYYEQQVSFHHPNVHLNFSRKMKYDPYPPETYSIPPPEALDEREMQAEPSTAEAQRGRERVRRRPRISAQSLYAGEMMVVPRRGPPERSPSPPTKVVKSTYGGNLFTPEDVVYLKKYIDYCNRQGQVLSLREICERIAVRVRQLVHFIGCLILTYHCSVHIIRESHRK